MHSKRVALYSARTAKLLNKDVKAAYLGGLFHDLGKLFFEPQLFDGHDISQEEYTQIKSHPLLGYTALSNIMLFTALSCGCHHDMSKSNHYALTINQLPNWSLNSIKKLLDIATIISVNDIIDAYITRSTSILDSNKNSLLDILYDKFPDDTNIIYTALSVRPELSFKIPFSTFIPHKHTQPLSFPK